MRRAWTQLARVPNWPHTPRVELALRGPYAEVLRAIAAVPIYLTEAHETVTIQRGRNA